MKTYWITVTTEEPLLIGDRHGDGSGALRSQTWIPGQTLRGAMAADWQHTVEESWFERAIAGGEIGFSPLFAVASMPKTGDIWGQIPATAASCKRFSGFGKSGHGVLDRLLQRETWPVEKPLTMDPNKGSSALDCAVCGSPLEKFRGFVHMHRTGDPEQIDLADRLITRTAVDDQIDSVVDGRLYSLKPLNEEHHFAGIIQMPDDLDDADLLAVERLRLGKARSRGLGRVAVSIQRQESPFAGPLEKRVRNFQKLLRDNGASPPGDETWVTLDLWSPLLLQDDLLRDRLCLKRVDFLPHGANLTWAVEPIALEAVWSGGWHGLLNLPRTHRQALAPGGVLALQIRGNPTDALAAMTSIETFGLGEGWADGFGRVLFCHPFHQQFTSKEVVHACI